MREQIEAIYENGVFRPLAPLPGQIREHQRYTLIVEGTGGMDNWLDGADPSVSLEAVRQALAKVSITLAQAVDAERAER
ncbi:MAG TPA: antitoxin family protein [Gemmataceae bacterium]|jgi:predicted DNA-binding antitoxin AbrB/MazE fold protein